MEEENISQREWEDYIEARDNVTKILSIPDSGMTDEIWAMWHNYNHIVDEVHQKYWYHVEELNQRYDDSLNRSN
jgi:hypothetical protein